MCPGHLKDKGFASPIIDEAEAAAKKKKEELDREIEVIKKEYEEKMKKRKTKDKTDKKDKDKAKDDEKKAKDEDEKAEKERDAKVRFSQIPDGCNRADEITRSKLWMIRNQHLQLMIYHVSMPFISKITSRDTFMKAKVARLVI